MVLRTRQHAHAHSAPYPATPRARHGARHSSHSSPDDWYIGPRSDEDSAIRNLPRTTAAGINNKRIHGALLLLAGPRPNAQPSVCGHSPSTFLGVGNNDPLNAGRWGTFCLECPPNNRVRWLTNRLDSSLITDNAELQAWFAIRHEINGLKRTGKTPTRCQVPDSLVTLSNSTPPSSPTPLSKSSKRNALRRPQGSASTSTAGALAMVSPELNREQGILLTFWIENHCVPISITIFPRFDSRVRLTDFKVELGALGVEQGDPIEVYHFGYGEWKAARWNQPHLVDPASRVLLVRFQGVNRLVDFEDTLTWAFPNTHTCHTDPKGKGRAF